MTTFRIGTRYACRSAGDSDCVWTFTVTARTARFVTLTDDQGDTYRVGVRISDDAEACNPFGHYSMSPTLRADRIAQ